MSEVARAPIENRLLAALPREEYDRLLPRLEPVNLPLKLVLIEPHQPIEAVYFINDGVMSLVIPGGNRRTVEVATIGNEGMIGLPVFLEANTMEVQAIVQVPGNGVRLRADHFRTAAEEGGAMAHLLRRYAHALFTQVAQAAACSRLHSIDARCARWLLQTRDRMRSDRFHLKQEFLAEMLGVGRPRVNGTATQLQKAGLIRYSRGQITIVDRAGLEDAACECYGIISRAYDRLRIL